MLKLIKTSCLAFLLILSVLFSKNVDAQADHKEEPFTVESYYKVQWGHAEEFMTLWKKNHYPLEKEAMKKGDIISISAENQNCIVVRIPAGIGRSLSPIKTVLPLLTTT